MFGVISRSKAIRVPVLKFRTIHNHAALGKYRYGKLADISPSMRLLRILCIWRQMRSGYRFGLTRGCLANPFLCCSTFHSVLSGVPSPSVQSRLSDSRKYWIVRIIPSSKLTLGSQPRTFFAREISGWRTFGSSSGRGLYSMVDFVTVMRMILSANCLIVTSLVLQRLTVSLKLLIFSVII